MANGTDNDIIFRDGTSQRSRMLPALDPKYFSVEEHSTEDLLRFAQKFAQELKFYNLNNEVEGDWSGLLGSEKDIADILAFLKNPNAFDHDPARKAWLTRPHLSLFLQFLEMLKEPKAQLDDLTRRHLEFYYRDVLRFGPKPWKADRVHVLFEPAKGVESVVIPKGTLLQAGKDTKGKFLHYQTLHELVMNQARVVDVRNTFRDVLTKDLNKPGDRKLFASIAWREGQTAGGKFQALGTDLLNTYPDKPVYARIGFAIESPLFRLSGGDRTIYLTFPDLEEYSGIERIFTFEISCGMGKWQSLIFKPTNDKAKSGLELVCNLPSTDKITAFSPPSGELDSEYAACKDPVLRVTLNQIMEFSDYKALSKINITTINIRVEVDQLEQIKCRNDQAVLSPKAPIEPFGSLPQKEAAFTFTHPEFCQKVIQKIRLSLKWRGLPDFNTLYKPYYAYLDGIESSLQSPTSGFSIKLENSVAQTVDKTTETTSVAADLDYSGVYTDLPDADDPLDFPRYFRCTLQTDLLHSIYPQVLQWYARPENVNTTDPVQSPYTPSIQFFSAGYSASAGISSGDAVLYHLHPFGVIPAPVSQHDQNDQAMYSLVPDYAICGCLYVGLADLNPPIDVGLLFQMWPGLTEQTGSETKAKWAYLDQDEWKELKPDEQILYDASDNLFRTGLMRLRLPKVTSLEHRLMPAGLYWLRAAADANFARAAGDLVAIHAQATEAEFTDRGNTLEHLQRPLPPDSIKTLVSRDPKIKSILQPYTSFGGRPKEAPERLYTRVSERLRHKQRALSAWDYERLVLEAFPEVYKVKCLLPWERERLAAYDPAGGAITLVVIPDISNTAPFFPIEPHAPLPLLNDIKTFLQSRAPAFAAITVKNPRYERIRYRMDIRFHRDYDPAICLYEAQEALKQYLSPWAYQEGADIPFGSRVYHSELIYLLENLAFVDYVLNFKLVLLQSESEVPQGCLPPALWVSASRPDAVLATHPNHIIWPIFNETKPIKEYKGIGYDIIGVDQKVFSSR